MVIVDVQRAGPSTGMPTKTEQTDLLAGDVRPPRRGAAAGRRRRARRRTASTWRSRRPDLAVKYRTPVILLSDGYLANSSEPWLLPDVDALPTDLRRVRDRAQPHRRRRQPEFWPYLRDPETLARPWAVPGTPGLQHRIGGIEKARRHRQHQLPARQPRAHGRAAPGEDRRHRRRHPRRRVGRRRTAPSCWSSAGARRGARSPPAFDGSVRNGHRVVAGAPGAPQPAAARSGRRARPVPEGARARDEPRPARQAARGPGTWSTCSSFTKVHGRALRGGRDRGAMIGSTMRR